MEAKGNFLRLEPRPAVRTVPLPLLLSRLWMLAAPAADLATILGEQASGNPLLSVEPPLGLSASGSAPLSVNEEEEEPWEGVAAWPSLEETLIPQLSLLPETALLAADRAYQGMVERFVAVLETEGLELLAALGIPAPAHVFVRSSREVTAAASPVAALSSCCNTPSTR